jgi:hypothetical protein
MNMNLDARDRSRILAVAILIAVFAAGLFGGAALALVFRSPRHVEREVFDVRLPEHPAFPGDGEGVVFLRTPDPLMEELDLDQAQRDRVERLMQEQAQKAERLMADTEPRMKALMDSTNAAIEQVLRPDQRERFRAIREERRDMIVRRFKMRVPAPPPEPALPPEPVPPPEP